MSHEIEEGDDLVDTHVAQKETNLVPPPRPPALRWVLVAMALLAALIAYGANAYLTSGAVDATANSFDRADLPGTITATMHPGEWRVWLEGPGTVESIDVIDGSGRPIEVRDGDGDTSYRHGGFESIAVASFTIPRGGLSPDVKVTVIGSAETPETSFAIGPADDFDYVRPAYYATVLVIALILFVAAAIAVMPVLRSRRSR